MISSVLPYYSASSRELVKIDVDVKSHPTVSLFCLCRCIAIDLSMYACVVFLGKIQYIRWNQWINNILYTVNITFLDSDCSCSSLLATLPVSFCIDGICNVTLTNLISLPCYKHPSQAEVAVYASNVLTDGLPSMILLSTLEN